MKTFNIDPKYFTSVHVYQSKSMYAGLTTLTNEQMIKVLKGQDIISSHTTRDHPEFDKLRTQLEDEGFISVKRESWNGDEVIKPFMLNNGSFRKGDRFPCGTAMGSHLKYR